MAAWWCGGVATCNCMWMPWLDAVACTIVYGMAFSFNICSEMITTITAITYYGTKIAKIADTH